MACGLLVTVHTNVTLLFDVTILSSGGWLMTGMAVVKKNQQVELDTRKLLF